MEQIGLAHTRVHGGNPWELMRQRGFSKDQVVDFSVDVNPLGFPPCVPEAILAHLAEIAQYPDPEASAVREAIAYAEQIPPQTILMGNGAAELIGLLLHTRALRNVMVIGPTFGEYAWMAQRVGAVVHPNVATEADGFRPRWCREQLQGMDAVFLCNPNNPTGVAIPKEEVLELAAWCQAAGALLVVDEAFVELTERPESWSLLPEVVLLDHIVVLRSLTKLFAIPGLRLGYLVAGDARVIDCVRGLQPPWPLNTFALAVGERVLRETAYIEHSRTTIRHLRERFTEKLRGVSSLQPFPSTTNFVLCKLLSARPAAADLCDQLEQQGLLIRNCDSFDGLESGRFIRLAVRQSHEQDLVIEALSEALG